MWTEITSENIEQIKKGTLICQKYPGEIISVNDITTTLETIYKVEIIAPGIEHGIEDITLKTNHLVDVYDISATRVVNRRELIDESWYVFLI